MNKSAPLNNRTASIILNTTVKGTEFTGTKLHNSDKLHNSATK